MVQCSSQAHAMATGILMPSCAAASSRAVFGDRKLQLLPRDSKDRAASRDVVCCDPRCDRKRATAFGAACERATALAMLRRRETRCQIAR